MNHSNFIAAWFLTRAVRLSSFFEPVPRDLPFLTIATFIIREHLGKFELCPSLGAG